MVVGIILPILVGSFILMITTVEPKKEWFTKKGLKARGKRRTPPPKTPQPKRR